MKQPRRTVDITAYGDYNNLETRAKLKNSKTEREMKEFIQKIKISRATKAASNFIASDYYAFITAAVILLCYYLGWDMVSIYYISLTGIFIVLACDDVTPLFTNFLFMAILVSAKNSPSPTLNCSDYYFRPAVYGQIVAVIALYASAIIYRIAKTAKRGKFRLTPVFFGLCALSATLLFNGFFSQNYNPMNMAYGFFLAFALIVTFALFKDNINYTEKTLSKVAVSFATLSAALIIELIVFYATAEGVFVDGIIQRYKIMFGWGMYNTMGMLFLISIPFVMYLAIKKKYGYMYFTYAIVIAAATVCTNSRQAMVGIAIVFPVCLLILLIKAKQDRIINLIITGLCIFVAIILLSVFREKIIMFFKSIDGSNGRFALWETAWNNFLSSPAFGTGFYVDLVQDPNYDGMELIPDMYHNTFMQLLASCGIFGFAAYAVHRAQTVASFLRNINTERIFIALSISALLILNLLDNHLFYIFPTFIYAALIALLVKSEKTGYNLKDSLQKLKS